MLSYLLLCWRTSVAAKKETKKPRVMGKKITKSPPKTLSKGKQPLEQNYSVAEKDLVDLPAIDMQAPEKEIIPKIIEMMSTVGFLHLKNVPGFEEDELLKDAKAFHSIPQELKKQAWPKHINKENSNIYRGWFPFLDNDPSHKEFYDMGQPIKDIDPEHL